MLKPTSYNTLRKRLADESGEMGNIDVRARAI